MSNWFFTRRRWRRTAMLDRDVDRMQLRMAPAFEPLELDPFDLLWPSQFVREDRSAIRPGALKEDGMHPARDGLEKPLVVPVRGRVRSARPSAAGS